MKLLNKWGHILDYVVSGGMWVASSVLAFTMFLICTAVFTRYFLREPIGWALEVCEYCLLIICFTGAAWLLKKGRHITIMFVLEQLKPKARAMINIITTSLATIVYLVLSWYSVLVAWDNYLRDVYIHKMLHAPKYVLIAIIAAGCLLLLIQLLRTLYGHIGHWRLLQRG